VSVAESLALQWKRDSMHNVCVYRPGRGKGIVLQAHTDIVAEKLSGSATDPATDPITAVLRDGWITSLETTLGADNGIGVAIMLALLESPSQSLPPLECLFTVDEERGLVGARLFPPEWLTQSRLINLDSEEENSICIGCAGGRDVVLNMELERDREEVQTALLTVDGLSGGHSGMEIGRGGANAVRLAARLCRETGLRVAEFAGGSKHNAIPRNASVIVAGSVSRKALEGAETMMREEYRGQEENIRLAFEPADLRFPLTEDCSQRLNDLLLALPHGVEAYSGTVPGLVQTSCNLAIVRTTDSMASITMSVRSSIDASRDALVERICSIGRLAGCTEVSGEGYPGWPPNPDSPLLARAVEACRASYGDEPSVLAIHAGLECGLIGRRVGGMDMISMGPDIRDVHIPGERVRVESVASFMKMLTMLLKSLAE